MEQFETALRSRDVAALAALFAAECHHRDLLAFSWTIRPTQGAEALAGFLADAQATSEAHCAQTHCGVPQ